ncbi:MAG TPA: CAP domain-containing protein, partial [Polyangiales bacterium]|nr:CAP domain-containing protein [Polyangiales bacterium]
LIADPQLAAIAASHNDDMLAHGFVGHTSKTSGTAGDRVVHAGIRTGLVLENIGRGYSLREVHAGLMESPGHRGNLLHPQATNVGIAVSVRAEEGHHTYLVTELFTRVTPKLDASATMTLMAAINRARTGSSRHQLRSDPGLERVATRAARECFSGSSGPSDTAVMERVRAGLAEIGAGKMPVSALLSMTSSLDEISTIAALLEPSVSTIGIGLAQGERADTPPNTLCAVLLLAQ